MSAEHTATLFGGHVLRDGRTIYVLHHTEDGHREVNLWSATVQGNGTAGAPEEQLDQIAVPLQHACNSYQQMLATLEDIRGFLRANGYDITLVDTAIRAAKGEK